MAGSDDTTDPISRRIAWSGLAVPEVTQTSRTREPFVEPQTSCAFLTLRDARHVSQQDTHSIVQHLYRIALRRQTCDDWDKRPKELVRESCTPRALPGGLT